MGIGLFGKKGGKPEHLALRLEFERKVLFEITDPAAAETITIGRSSDCTWTIPSEDHVASGHHAAILMHDGRFCLRDTGSRNGIFFKGKKIREKNLAPGDQFSIGSCTLFVEKVTTLAGAAPHELVFLNTVRKGETFKLASPRVVAGSAPGCDLQIDEQLVSQRHAEFNSKADGCWLKDLGSKNGTLVNGAKLAAGNERLLADDDVVSIAFVDFKFVDGRIEHSKIRIWYSLGIIAVTVFAALTLNWFWMNMKNSSDACLDSARQAAAAQQFEQARAFIRESRTRRGADTNEIARNELDQSITVWEKVLRNWLEAQASLASGNWVDASRTLGMITDDNPNIWGWNDTTAPEMRKEAFAAKKLLDAFLAAENLMRDDRNRQNLAELKQTMNVIRDMESAFGDKPAKHLVQLLAEAKAVRKQIEKNLEYLDRLERILARIEAESGNLAMVLGDLDELKQQAEPSIRVRIETCMVPLSMLQRSGKEIKRGIIMLRNLDFAGLEKIRLNLPTLEQCSVNAYIATLRKQQERSFDAVLATAANLQPLIRQLEQAGLTADADLPDYVRIFADRKVMAKVLACDALDRKMPSRLREVPAGEYDRLLGIEGFFEFIYALPAPYDQTIYSEYKFTPAIVRFRGLLARIRSFRTFAERKDLDWLRLGTFERLYGRTGEVLAFRDKLAWDLTNAKYDLPRQAVLAKAIAVFLADETLPEAEMNAFCKEIKDLRMPLIKLGRDYNTAPDEQKIVIRDQILRQGLPGDPVVRRMWGFKKY